MGDGVVSCLGKELTKSFQAIESDTHNQHAQSDGCTRMTTGLSLCLLTPGAFNTSAQAEPLMSFVLLHMSCH